MDAVPTGGHPQSRSPEKSRSPIASPGRPLGSARAPPCGKTPLWLWDPPPPHTHGVCASSRPPLRNLESDAPDEPSWPCGFPTPTPWVVHRRLAPSSCSLCRRRWSRRGSYSRPAPLFPASSRRLVSPPGDSLLPLFCSSGKGLTSTGLPELVCFWY